MVNCDCGIHTLCDCDANETFLKIPVDVYVENKFILKVDIDKKPQLSYLKSSIEPKIFNIMELIKSNRSEITISETHKGYHIIVDIECNNSNLTELENNLLIVFCQLYLGSDENREIFNVGRILSNMKNWNVLFKIKKQNGEIISRETFIDSYIIEKDNIEEE